MIATKISYFFVNFFYQNNMANKTLKTKQKSLASDIVSSIETKLGATGEATKKIKKSIEKSADKLAKKLTKLMHKADKKAAKPAKKEKKKGGKEKKNMTKAEKSLQRIANNTLTNAGSATLQTPPRTTQPTSAPKPAASGKAVSTARPKTTPVQPPIAEETTITNS